MNPNDEKPKSPHSPKKMRMLNQWELAKAARLDDEQARREMKDERAQSRKAKYNVTE